MEVRFLSETLNNSYIKGGEGMSEAEVVEVPKVEEEHSESFVRSVFFVSINAGKVLLESGAETYRIEDTMTRIATAYGIENTQVFVTPTVIIFSINDYSLTQTVRIDERFNNLSRVIEINALSREISNGLPIKKAIERLETIHETSSLPLWIMVIAAGFASAMFLIMFNGVPSDMLIAFVGGAGALLINEAMLRYTRIKFFTEFFASFYVAIIATSYVAIGFSSTEMLNTIIIASVMPLVPGVLITNAVREMIRGHLMAGATKGIEAMLTAIAIGVGVGVVFII